MRITQNKLGLLLIALAATSNLDAADRVYIPQKNIIGANVSRAVELFEPNGGKVIFPVNVSVDIEMGKISGVVFHYADQVPLHSIEQEVNRLFGQWFVHSLDSMEVKVWRVESLQYSVLLSKDEDGNPRLIYAKWNKPR